MHDQHSMTRRRFVKTSLTMAAGIPVLTMAGRALAADMPQLEPTDPMAVALKYTHDATTAERADEAHLCANCIQFLGDADAEWGGCLLFPDKGVAAKGWCNAYVKKPA